MKIIERKEPVVPKPPWVGLRVTCLCCGSVLELEEGDSVTSKRTAGTYYKKNVLFRRHINYIRFDCPVCNKENLIEQS